MLVLLLICGALNHLHDVLSNGFADRNTFLNNLMNATFTALPMCTFALLLIGHQSTLQKRLYRQATRDPLTDLHNRRWFMDKTPMVLQPNQALLIVDVDHFKAINDNFGHDAGDRCLQELASSLLALIRSSDACARIGGEEFVILLRDVALSDVQSIAGRISAGIKFIPVDGIVRHVTSSVGIAFDDTEQERAYALLRADEAVYRAKANGRARYVVAKPAEENDLTELTLTTV